MIMVLQPGIRFCLFWIQAILAGLCFCEELMDVVSGTSVVLECRFDPQLNQKHSTLYWIRSNRRNHDNVAIGETAFHQDYRVDHYPMEGRYDLHVTHSEYDRDNGKFECRIKEDGTGVELYTKTIALTVLLPPQPPAITKSTVEAVEGQPYSMLCSSSGGSPAPEIRWIRVDDGNQLSANVTKAADKDAETVSVLEIVPKKEDDGVKFRCEVNNRAMSALENMATSINISVNYFPVVTVGPDNPYRVEVDHTAEMKCKVDSKPRTDSVRWEFSGRFIDTNFRHVIPQVSMQDAGSYYCSGDNGLGHIDKEELILDVQYGPQIVVSGANDVDLGDTISINCQVSANPRPLGVQWFRKQKPDFVQQGQTLHIGSAKAEDSGEYVCNSYNFIHPSGRDRQRREKNATVVINVRHKPGKASILPEEAIAVAGRSVTLVCHADPPGYPEPTYRWWREGRDSTILAVSSHYTIENVEVGSAGRYYCQPHNSLGHVQPASVDLQVYQTPKLTSKPQPKMTKKAGDSNLQISCSSTAKPKPNVRWFKDGIEIVSGVSTQYQVSTNEQGQNVLSTLSFVGPTRANTNRLDHTDKGHYSCQFENQVGRSENTMLLVIEHAPIPAHRHSKVAFDIGEKGQISCKMQAYPEPRFDWTFGDDVLELDVVNYYSNVSQLDEDLFESVLTVTKVRKTSYGEYTCRALNSMGARRTKIHMQRKGPPEKPSNLEALDVGSDSAMLEWNPGFDGGHADTDFIVEYTRKVDGRVESGHCQSQIVCNITNLHQHSTYTIKVKAINSAGESSWSEPITINTLVDLLNIPRPDSLVFEKSTKLAHVKAPTTELMLVAELEVQSDDGGWKKYAEHKLSHDTYGQMPVSMAQSAYNQLPITEQGSPQDYGHPAGIRVRLCLEDNLLACGPYLEGRVVDELDLAQPWLIALIVVVTLLGLVAVLIAIKCVCQTRKNPTKSTPGRGAKILGPSSIGRHNPNIDTYKAQMFAIAGENQHGTMTGYDINQQIEQGSSNSQTDSANSQEPLWAYQKSPSEGQFDPHYPSQALQGYENSVDHYPYIDQTPTDPDRNYFAYRDPAEAATRPMSGQYNCATGMGDSQYSYQGLPDPSSYFVNQSVSETSPNIFICDNSIEGLQTPNTRARRVVHEVIV